MVKKYIYFDVVEQTIVRSPGGTDVVADSRNYLYACFNFSAEWDGQNKTAVFTHGENVYHVLLSNDECVVPHEVIKSPAYSVSVFAGDLITANETQVDVGVSGLKEGISPPKPTLDIYNQLVEKVITESEKATTAKNSAVQSADVAEKAAKDAKESQNSALDAVEAISNYQEETELAKREAILSAENAKQSEDNAKYFMEKSENYSGNAQDKADIAADSAEKAKSYYDNIIAMNLVSRKDVDFLHNQKADKQKTANAIVEETGRASYITIPDIAPNTDFNRIRIYSESWQSGVPTPQNPVDIMANSSLVLCRDTAQGVNFKSVQINQILRSIPGVAEDYIEVDKNAGTVKVVRECNLFELDASQDWQPGGEWARLNLAGYPSNGKKTFFYTHGTYGSLASGGGADWASIDQLRVYFAPLGVSTLAEYKTYLAEQSAAGTPLTVLYALETPTEEDITDTVLGQLLLDVQAISPKTILYLSAPVASAASLQVRYNQDTNVTVQAVDKLLDKSIKLYGVSFTGSSPEGTRLGDAVGMTAAVGVDSQVVKNDFDKIYPWSEMRRCNGYYDDNGNFVVTAYAGEPGYAVDGTNGNVWVEVPQFYVKEIIDGETEEKYITAYNMAGYRLPDKFIKLDGTIRRKVYIAAYEAGKADGVPVSYSGVDVSVPAWSHNSFVNACKTIGNGYCAYTMEDYEILSFLFQVEFATRDSQSIMPGFVNPTTTAVAVAEATTDVNYVLVPGETTCFAAGRPIKLHTTANSAAGEYHEVTDVVAYGDMKKVILEDGASVTTTTDTKIYCCPFKSGYTDNVAASSGAYKANNGYYPIKYRGIENPWGNCWTIMSGILINNHQPYMLKDASSVPVDNSAASIIDTMMPLNYVIPSANGYAKAMGYDGRYPAYRLTTAAGGSTSTYYCDYFYQNTGIRAVMSGGDCSNGTQDGLFYFYCYYAPSGTRWSFSSRLSYAG